MHSENMTHHQSDWEECAVCGNCVEPGHGPVRINHHGNTVCLCNPACLRTFAQEPDPYAGKASYYEVLEAQQQLFPAENTLSQIEANRRLIMVQFYKALEEAGT
jgi:ribosomal protein L24E